jgi:DNA-binding response OmpR family regulator
VTSSHSLILVVDDDPGILKLVRLELTEQDFRVITAENGEDAIRAVEEHHPDLVVLDVVLPDISGLEVLRRLRQRSPIPIILLTAKGGDADKVRGLEMGADDYLAKPFNPEELSARVRAVLRRERRQAAPVASNLKVGELEIDLERRVVMRQGDIVPLTRTEWNLLHHLAANAGKVMVTAEILSKVWGPEYRDDVQYLRVWISRLRGKLEPDRPDQSMIRTFPGIGYMLDTSVYDGKEAQEATASS